MFDSSLVLRGIERLWAPLALILSASFLFLTLVPKWNRIYELETEGDYLPPRLLIECPQSAPHQVDSDLLLNCQQVESQFLGAVHFALSRVSFEVDCT